MVEVRHEGGNQLNTSNEEIRGEHGVDEGLVLTEALSQGKSAQERGAEESEEEVRLQEAGEIESEKPVVSLPAAISGLLFVAAKPLSLDTLVEVTGEDPSKVEEALSEVLVMFSDDFHGFSVHYVSGGYQLRTAPGLASAVKRLFPPKTRRLSRAAAETLAVIAYKQPVQRAEIEAIRGVDALPTLKTLLEQKLVRVVGHEDVVGQPAVYGTTPTFLERFGLRDLADLPTVRELEQLDEELGEVDAGDDEARQIESGTI